MIIVVGTVGGVELVDSYAKDGTYSDPSAPESDSTDVVITDTIFSFISLAWLRDHVRLSIASNLSLEPFKPSTDVPKTNTSLAYQSSG